MDDSTIVQLRAELARLHQRITELEAAGAPRPADTPADGATSELSRRALLRRIGTVAAVGGAAAAGGLAVANPAAAADGDAIRAGRTTTADVETRLDGGLFTSAAPSSATWALYGIGAGNVTSFTLQQCAVLAESYGAAGVLALSTQSYGVLAKTEAGHHAVHGQYGSDDATFPAIEDAAVGGVATGSNGVVGVTDTGAGVIGRSDEGVGVDGRTTSGAAGVYAESSSPTGFTPAVYAAGFGRGSALIASANNTANNSAAAVLRNRGTGPGVSGTSTKGLGGTFSGAQAAIRLVPRSTTGHPTTGAHVIGELVVDSVGALFLCTAAGTPGTWMRVTVT